MLIIFQMASSIRANSSARRFTNVGVLPKIERNVFIVKQSCTEPKDGVSTDESAAIMLYAFETNCIT